MSDIAGGVETAAKGHIGKFPIWLVALVIVGVGGGAYMLYSRNSGGAAAAAPTADATTTDSGYTGDGLPAADSSTDTSSGASSSLLSTNQAWLARATAGVSAAFLASPTTVYGVLYNYVNGNDWNASQQKYIDRALTDYGQPPEGTSGLGTSINDVVSAPTPVTKPPVVIVKNPGTKPPVKVAPKPAPVTVATAPVGARVTLSHSYSGYLTATAANAGGKSPVRTGTGTYYVFNRVARSHGEMVNVSRVKGVPGAWINP